MNELNKLANCNRPWAAERAKYALELANAIQNGQVSKDEGRALLEDLVRTDILDNEADNAEMRAMLVSGVTQLASFLL